MPHAFRGSVLFARGGTDYIRRYCMNKTDRDLLERIYKNADMGRSSIGKVIEVCEDTALKGTLKQQYDNYNRVAMSAATLLRSAGGKVKPAKMANMGASAMISMDMLADKSSAHIAEMTLRGNDKGIKAIEDSLMDSPQADKNIVALAESLRDHIADNTRELLHFV